MPVKVGKSDRRFLLWAGVLLLPLIAAVALLSDEDEESNVPSTYSAQTQGAKAAYLLLQEQGYKVERWMRRPTQLPQDAGGTVYVLAGPWGAPTREDKNALQDYLTRGGKVLATSYSANFFL